MSKFKLHKTRKKCTGCASHFQVWNARDLLCVVKILVLQLYELECTMYLVHEVGTQEILDNFPL
eukprot:c27789_g1_i1 orf=91-282(+)